MQGFLATLLSAVLAALQVAAFAAMAFDKFKARAGRWRTRERDLLFFYFTCMRPCPLYAQNKEARLSCHGHWRFSSCRNRLLLRCIVWSIIPCWSSRSQSPSPYAPMLASSFGGVEAYGLSAQGIDPSRHRRQGIYVPIGTGMFGCSRTPTEVQRTAFFDNQTPSNTSKSVV